MDKINLIKTLQKQAMSFDTDVQNKLSSIISDDYVFTDVSTYTAILSTTHKSDMDLPQEAFKTDHVQRAITPTSKTEQLTQKLSDIRQDTILSQPTTNKLSNKIAALRGCSLPGS
ncbi:MAG: hypothetical protein IJX20_00340, partial [Alphaproteobacteria bacterium]|nr:hypothetical protein [Alphaproteobacteria bacterium]